MQKTILLADEDLAVRRMLCRVLAVENYLVIPAKDGEDVLHRLRETSVDLLLLDLYASGTNGQQLLQKVRIENPKVPVIVISSEPNEAVLGWAPGQGAQMEKPLDLFKLLRTIDELLGDAIKGAKAQSEVRCRVSNAQPGRISASREAGFI